MGYSRFLRIFLQFCMIPLSSVFVLSKQSNHTSDVSPTVMFALKAQQIPSGSIRRPASKLPFHHNVSLTVSLLVGTPPQPVTMVLDTGSELSWLHCKKSPGLNALFDPLHSTSYSRIPCTSPTCRARTRDFNIPASCDPKKLCHVAVSYADFSSMEGTLAMDNFKMGGSSMPGVFFGCMDQGFSSSDSDSRTTGLLGMNRGSLSFVTQMSYPKFSYCISGQDASGVLLFGEANFSWLKQRSYTPMVKVTSPLPYFDRVAYSVQFEGIKVGGKLLSIPKSLLQPDHTGAGQTMVDSGTQFTFLLGPVYSALKNEFLGQTRSMLRELGDPNYVFQGAMDLCYRVPLTQKGYPILPTVTLVFQGADMSVSTEQLLYRVPGEVRGTDGVHCFTFGNSDLLGVEAYIIGHHHQQNMWMEFDYANLRYVCMLYGMFLVVVLAKAQAPAMSPAIASPTPPLPPSKPPTLATPLPSLTPPASSPTAPPPPTTPVSPPVQTPSLPPSLPVQTPSLPPAPVTQLPPPVQPPTQPPALPPVPVSPPPAVSPAPAPTKQAPAPSPVAISPSLAPVNSPSTAPAPAPSEGKKKRKHKHKHKRHHHAPAPAPIPPSPPAPPTAVSDTSDDTSPAPSPDLNEGISIYLQGNARSKWMTGLVAAALLLVL